MPQAPTPYLASRALPSSPLLLSLLSFKYNRIEPYTLRVPDRYKSSFDSIGRSLRVPILYSMSRSSETCFLTVRENKKDILGYLYRYP
jgi:hypothetical protein